MTKNTLLNKSRNSENLKELSNELEKTSTNVYIVN